MAKVLLLTLVANSAALRGDRECGVEGGEAGAAGRRLGSPRPPVAEPDEIDGDGGHDVLQVRLGEAEVAGMAQAAAADGLLVGGLDAGARRVARAELGRRLPVPGGVQSLVVLARLQADDPRLELGPGAAGTACSPSERSGPRTPCRSSGRCRAARRCCACRPGR